MSLIPDPICRSYADHQAEEEALATRGETATGRARRSSVPTDSHEMLLEPISMSGTLHRVEGTHGRAPTSSLRLEVSPVQLNLTDRQLAAIHSRLGHFQAHHLWKHYTLMKSISAPPEDARADVIARKRWRDAGHAVTRTLVSSSPPGKFGGSGFAELINNLQEKLE